MSHPLAEFLDGLASTSELARVTAPVDPRLELAEITRRVSKAGGPALFFDQLARRTLPAVANLLGTEARLCRALGLDSLAELSERIQRPLLASSSWFDRLRGSDAGSLEKLRPRAVKQGDCQQVVRLGRDIDLAQLPAIQSWPGESGVQLTAGRLVSSDQSGKSRGVELARLQVVDQNSLAVIDDGQELFPCHLRDARERHEKLPVAVALGGPPSDTLAAWLNLTEPADGYLWAGLLRGAPIELVKCRTQAVDAPADTDLILEGYIDPDEPPAGPTTSSLASGYYAAAAPASILHLTAITSRTNPVIPAIVPGANGELGVLHRAKERILLPLVQGAIPEVVEFSLPAWGGFERCAVLAIHKSYPQQASKAASALWGLSSLRSTKFIIVVDADVDPHDREQVLVAIGANVHPGRDLFFHPGPAHASDHAAPSRLVGHAVGIDATSKLAAEHSGPWPGKLRVDEQAAELVSRKWKEYGLH